MKKSLQISTIVLLFILFNSLFVRAQRFSMTTDTIEIDEVVVTGTPVKVTRNNVPMAVSIVSRKQIEQSNESALLPVLNGRVPGLFVTERGITGFGVAAGSAGQISIRGIGGNPTTGVLILIDGHPQFMGIMGHPLPDSYVSSDVERVEVIRGPASVLYGSNAMGGVINIITRKQNKNGIHGNARLSYGSFNTQKYMSSLGYKKNKYSVFASVNHDQTDGHRPHSDFNITNGYLKIGYEINKHLSASSDFSLAFFKASDPGPDTINAKAGNKIDITRGYWAFTLLNEFENVSGAVKLFYNFGEHLITDGFHSTDHNYGANLYEALQLFKGNTFTAGFDIMNYGGLAENTVIMNGIVFADTSLIEYGFYGFTQQEIGQLTLNAGIRYQNNSQFGSVWIPTLGFAMEISNSTTWKGTVSKGYRSPTMRELFMWGPNPNLNPETIWNYETGIIASFAQKRIQAELTAFIVNGDNLIVNVGPPSGFLNTDEISNQGIEMAVKTQVLKNLELNTTYSFIHMNNPVFATPEHHFFLEGTSVLNKLQLSSSFQFVKNLDTDPSSFVYNVSYTLLNAKAHYKLSRNVGLMISAENLLNTKYEVTRFYTMPGTSVFGGINLNF